MLLCKETCKLLVRLEDGLARYTALHLSPSSHTTGASGPVSSPSVLHQCPPPVSSPPVSSPRAQLEAIRPHTERLAGLETSGRVKGVILTLRWSQHSPASCLAPVPPGLAPAFLLFLLLLLPSGVAPVPPGLTLILPGIAPVSHAIAPVPLSYALVPYGLAPVPSGIVTLTFGLTPVPLGLATVSLVLLKCLLVLLLFLFFLLLIRLVMLLFFHVPVYPCLDPVLPGFLLFLL